MTEARPSPVERLLRRIDVEPRGQDLFSGNPGPGEGRLFGGLVAAQSVVAAGRTVASGTLHSLHAYFLRPGRHGVPIRFAVDRIRDGRTFTTRRVVAQQGGEAIFNLSASFTRPEEGIAHQDRMPEAPAPESLPPEAERRGPPHWHTPAVELLVCEPDELGEGDDPDAARRVWMRPVGSVGEDPLLHAALLVYASDRMLLFTAARRHRIRRERRRGASLDHSVWLHRVPCFDDWVLYVTQSPVAFSARGLITGAMYRRSDGARIASVAQEGLIRLRR